MTTFCSLALIPLLGIGPVVEPPAAAVPKGRLVVDGGGKASPAVRKRTLAASGGPKAKVLVVPQASSLPQAGPIAAARWREIGAEDVAILDLADAGAIEKVRRADLIWIGGGDQGRFMERLRGTGIPEAIRARYRDGGTVGGSSAGAAVMSRVMIARGAEDHPKPLANYPILSEGLGLWPEVIVDQHFLKLDRTDRLKRAVAEYPDLIGVGVDESTAVIVRGRSIEVVGESRVVVIDMRKAEAKVPAVIASTGGGGDGPPPSGSPPSPRVSTLNPGVTFDLDRGMIAEPIAEER